jgi:hypothetical protein
MRRACAICPGGSGASRRCKSSGTARMSAAADSTSYGSLASANGSTESYGRSWDLSASRPVRMGSAELAESPMDQGPQQTTGTYE